MGPFFTSDYRLRRRQNNRFWPISEVAARIIEVRSAGQTRFAHVEFFASTNFARQAAVCKHAWAPISLSDCGRADCTRGGEARLPGVQIGTGEASVEIDLAHPVKMYQSMREIWGAVRATKP